METSKEYIVKNMSQFERYVYLNSFKFVGILTLVLIVLGVVCNMLNLSNEYTMLIGGNISMLWIIYAVINTKMAKRVTELLLKGGFRKEILKDFEK